ncbi:MAG TPA: zf-HC2 domain-containing protein [Candidatus Binatia bacterium]|jgi:anti-sigma factor RsiW|nr:zf-HC2 domain-containing protein [Candidatus Binatia bacterium]
MTCAEVDRHLDAFVDGELPAAMLLEVARHASGCATCDAAVRTLTELQHRIAATAEADAAALDLSGVWPAVAAGIEREESRATWTRRMAMAPTLAAAFALAAAALFWVRAASGPSGEVPRVATHRPNQAVIERLDSEARIELRRERKNGTTLIMVSDDGEAAR